MFVIGLTSLNCSLELNVWCKLTLSAVERSVSKGQPSSCECSSSLRLILAVVCHGGELLPPRNRGTTVLEVGHQTFVPDEVR